MSVFDSVEAMLAAADERNMPLWELILYSAAKESGLDRESSLSLMRQRLDAMREADASYSPEQRSRSGLSGGDGE